MPTKVTSGNVLADSTGIGKVWKANPDMKLGKNGDTVTFKNYQDTITEVEDFDSQIEELSHQIGGLRDQRDDAAKTLNGYNTRALSAIRGIFGPDSAEYDQAGGTRSSERKSAKRKAKTVTA